MADKKISALDAAAALTGAELVPVVQGGANVKATAQAIADLAAASNLNYADLADAATADLPGINTPLAQALALKANTADISPTGNYLISGGGVGYTGGLSLTVSAAAYVIQGTIYASAQTNLTLAAADATHDRIDVIAVNSSGAAVVIQGTPDATPVKPDVDPESQIELTFFLVAATATDLEVTVTDVYHENTEWTTSRSGTTFVLNSTNNPRAGTVCIEGTAATTGNYFQFATTAFDPASFENLTFYVRSKATWVDTRSISITLRSGNNTQRGSLVTFKAGSFGFNSSNTTDYQQIVIPMSIFGANGLSVDRIRFAVVGTGTTLGAYFDDFTLQNGAATTSVTTGPVNLASGVTGVLAIANGGTAASTAAGARSNLGIGTAGTLAFSIDDTMAADSDALIPTQQAVKGYVDAQFAGAGTGDVVGPASAVNNRVVFFDGVSGKLIKDSGLTLSGSNTGDQTITLTGDVTGSGTGSFATTLANTAVSPGSYTLASITVGADGRITAASSGSAGGSGDVVGPASATNNALALFDGVTGKLLKDSTYTITAAGAALLDDATASDQRTTLGLAIGANVQAYDAQLADIAAITFAQGDVLYFNGTNLVALAAGTSGHFLKTNGVGANPAWAAASGGGTAGRHAIYIAAGSMRPSVTGGCAALAGIASAANQPDIVTLDFDTTTQEYAQFGVVMPKSWDEGTITFVAHWSHAATTTNFGVVWDLQAVAVSNDDPIAVAFGTAQTSTDTGGTTNDLYTSPESGAITVAGTPAAEDMVFFRLSRVTGNGGDTMAIDARLHGVTLYITTNADTDA